MRDQTIRIRVDATEIGKIRQLASGRGLTVSELMRRSALGVRMPARKFDRTHVALFARMLGELGRVGGNLNQLVRRGNAGMLVGHDADLARTLAQIDMLRDCIREVVS